MKLRKGFIAFAGDGVCCAAHVSDSVVGNVAAVVRLLARECPNELARVCFRPGVETAEEWVEMMAKGRAVCYD